MLIDRATILPKDIIGDHLRQDNLGEAGHPGSPVASTASAGHAGAGCERRADTAGNPVMR